MSTVSYDFAASARVPIQATLDRYPMRHTLQAAQTAPQAGMTGRDVSQRLELSESRTYDSALAILGAYKLTGNFPTELEIVLHHLGVFDKVTYEIEPKAPLSDLRHVTFRPDDNVHADRFREIVHLVNGRIGCDATLSWWVRLFRKDPLR